MLDLFQAMKAPPPGPATPLTTYTYVNGVLYLGLGLTFMLYPYVLELGGYPAITPAAAGPLRGVGVAVIYIALFYLWTARSRFVPGALGSVFNRVVLGPLLILPLVGLGLMEPMLGVPMVLMDVVFGIGMYVAWKRSLVAAGATPISPGGTHV